MGLVGRWCRPMRNFFICYPRCRESRARRLASDLRVEGHSYWFDLERLGPNDDLEAEIERGVRESDAILLIPSWNRTLTSWMDYELAVGLELNKPILECEVLERHEDAGDPLPWRARVVRGGDRRRVELKGAGHGAGLQGRARGGRTRWRLPQRCGGSGAQPLAGGAGPLRGRPELGGTPGGARVPAGGTGGGDAVPG